MSSHIPVGSSYLSVVDNFGNWLEFSGGSRMSVLVTFDFISDVEPLKKLGRTWVTHLICPKANKLDVHLSYKEGLMSLELNICGQDSEDVPTFVWKASQGKGKVLAEAVNYFLQSVYELGVRKPEEGLRYSRDGIKNLPRDELRNLSRSLNI